MLLIQDHAPRVVAKSEFDVHVFWFEDMVIPHLSPHYRY